MSVIIGYLTCKQNTSPLPKLYSNQTGLGSSLSKGSKVRLQVLSGFQEHAEYMLIVPMTFFSLKTKQNTLKYLQLMFISTKLMTW